MARSDQNVTKSVHAAPLKGLEPLTADGTSPDHLHVASGEACARGELHSGCLHRPLQSIRRCAVTAESARTELERYKLSMRKFAPVQKGASGLPWTGQWQCPGCASVIPGSFQYDESADAIYLETECPQCGRIRQHHHDTLFVKNVPGRDRPHQPATTHSGSPIRPVLRELPRTVETLCPECRAIILGRYFVKDDIVWIEKTCPDHGYFRDKINSDYRLYLLGTRRNWQDERGVLRPQVTGAQACPSDCGLCNQHHSTSCLAQIDLTNRCNLTCPVCFANANTAGYVAEPSFDLVVEMLQTLRDQHPYPATAIQFTGGEPTIHPDFLRIIEKTGTMGFSHIQIATNGIKLADPAFCRQAASAGLHTLYLQFDGLSDEVYRQTRGVPLLDKKYACIENCRRNDIKICLVPTIINNCNRDQVGEIFRFAVQNADVISGISYQPVAITGRIDRQQLERMRYTLGDLAHDLADASGADPYEEMFPLSIIPPVARMLQILDGKPKIRPSCHTDCAFGSYFFITPEKEAIPIPRLFDLFKLFGGFNELALKLTEQRGDRPATTSEKLAVAWTFLKSYRWKNFDRRINPFTFCRAMRGMTDKAVGRGESGRKTFRTLMAAGMHFMDRYNYDTERIKRCVILYSTPDGVYPFCTINGGPEYRPYIEQLIAETPEEYRRRRQETP